jgi:hypothetical protein
MSIEKAKSFVENLQKDRDLQEKFKGFTLAELQAAINQAETELKDDDLDNVAGGGCLIQW